MTTTAVDLCEPAELSDALEHTERLVENCCQVSDGGRAQRKRFEVFRDM